MKEILDLEIQRLIIHERIKTWELDLNSPLEANTNFLRKFMEFEVLNLRKIDLEIFNLREKSMPVIISLA